MRASPESTQPILCFEVLLFVFISHLRTRQTREFTHKASPSALSGPRHFGFEVSFGLICWFEILSIYSLPVHKKKMTSFHSELEKQLKEVGNRLLNPPSSIDDLLTLLDEVENLLAYVEQVPSKSVRGALFLSVKALINNKLLRHAEMDVNVSVVSCIIEITRITAPDAPYKDEQMKEIF